MPVGVGHPDPVHRQRGRPAVEEETLLRDVGPLAALAAEPALVRHPLPEEVADGGHRGPPGRSVPARVSLSPGISSASLTTPAASRESATALEPAAPSQSSVSSTSGSTGCCSSNQ